MITFDPDALRPIVRTFSGFPTMFRSFGTVSVGVVLLQTVPEIVHQSSGPVSAWQWLQIAAITWAVLKFLLGPLMVKLVKSSLKDEFAAIDQRILTLNGTLTAVHDEQVGVKFAVEQLKEEQEHLKETATVQARAILENTRDISQVQGYNAAKQDE